APIDVAQSIKETQADLLNRRMTNLKSLHDDYDLKAKQAANIGDLENQIKYKSLADKVAAKRAELHDKSMETIGAAHDVAAQQRSDTAAAAAERVAGIHEAGAASREAAKASARMGDIQDVITNSTYTAPTGTPYIDLTQFT